MAIDGFARHPYIEAEPAKGRHTKNGSSDGIPGHLSGYLAQVDSPRPYGRERYQAPS